MSKVPKGYGALSKKDKKEFLHYLRCLADQIGLKDWIFEVIADPCEDDAFAICKPAYGKRKADLWFSHDLRNLPLEVIRRTIVHELLHCHHAAPQHIVQCNVEPFMGEAAYSIFMDAWRLAHETAIDSISRAWEDDFPLIKWPS